MMKNRAFSLLLLSAVLFASLACRLTRDNSVTVEILSPRDGGEIAYSPDADSVLVPIRIRTDGQVLTSIGFPGEEAFWKGDRPEEDARLVNPLIFAEFDKQGYVVLELSVFAFKSEKAQEVWGWGVVEDRKVKTPTTKSFFKVISRPPEISVQFEQNAEGEVLVNLTCATPSSGCAIGWSLCFDRQAFNWNTEEIPSWGKLGIPIQPRSGEGLGQGTGSIGLGYQTLGAMIRLVIVATDLAGQGDLGNLATYEAVLQVTENGIEVVDEPALQSLTDGLMALGNVLARPDAEYVKERMLMTSLPQGGVIARRAVETNQGTNLERTGDDAWNLAGALFDAFFILWGVVPGPGPP